MPRSVPHTSAVAAFQNGRKSEFGGDHISSLFQGLCYLCGLAQEPYVYPPSISCNAFGDLIQFLLRPADKG